MSDKKAEKKEAPKKDKKADAEAAIDALVEKMGSPHYDDHKYVAEIQAIRDAL